MKLWQLFSLGRCALLLAEQVGKFQGAQHVIAFDDRVGKALADGGHRVTRLEREGAVPTEVGSVDGVCFDALAESADPIERLRATVRAVRPGGFVLSATASRLTDHALAARLTAAYLHAGLGELRQEKRRGMLLTSGRVRRGG